MGEFVTRSTQKWNELYESGATAWDSGKPDEYLVAMVTDGLVRPGMAIDIGCGRGNESLFLAESGFTVVGLDISDVAIRQAQERIPDGMSEIMFATMNFVDFKDGLGGVLDFAFDRRAFHFLDDHDREQYIRKLAFLLRTDGTYMQIVSSEHETGDTRRHYSEGDLRSLFGQWFNLASIRLVQLEAHGEKPYSYVCLWQRNEIPIE